MSLRNGGRANSGTGTSRGNWWSFQLFDDSAGRITLENLTRAVRGSNEKLDDNIVDRNTLKRRYCKSWRMNKIYGVTSEVGCNGYPGVKRDRISVLNLGGFGYSSRTSRVQYA